MSKRHPYIVTLEYKYTVYAESSNKAETEAINTLAISLIGYSGHFEDMIREYFNIKVR